jgi:hypothetical protein
MSAMLMSKEVYAITIWALLCATVIAPFAFRAVLKKYTLKLEEHGRQTFMTVPEGVGLDTQHCPSDRMDLDEEAARKGAENPPAPSDEKLPIEFNQAEAKVALAVPGDAEKIATLEGRMRELEDRIALEDRVKQLEQRMQGMAAV